MTSKHFHMKVLLVLVVGISISGIVYGMVTDYFSPSKILVKKLNEHVGQGIDIPSPTKLVPDEIRFTTSIVLTSDSGNQKTFSSVSMPMYQKLDLTSNTNASIDTSTYNNGQISMLMNSTTGKFTLGNGQTYNGTGKINIAVDGNPYQSFPINFGNPSLFQNPSPVLFGVPFCLSGSLVPQTIECSPVSQTLTHYIGTPQNQQGAAASIRGISTMFNSDINTVDWNISNLKLSIYNQNVKTNYGSNSTTQIYVISFKKDSNGVITWIPSGTGQPVAISIGDCRIAC